MNPLQLVRNVGIYTALSVAQAAVGFILLPVYTRVMPPEQYGIVATVMALVTFLSIVVGLGLRFAAGRFIFDEQYRSDDDQARLLGTITIMAILAAIVLGGLLVLFGRVLLSPWLGGIPLAPYVYLGIAIAATQPILGVYGEYLRMKQAAGRYALIFGGLFLLTVALSVLLVIGYRLEATGALAAHAISHGVFVGLTLAVFGRRIRWRLDPAIARSVLGYALPLVPHRMTAALVGRADRFFLTDMAGTAVTGVYSVGAAIAMIVDVLTTATSHSARPLLFERLGTPGERARRELSQLLNASMIVFTLVAVAVALASREIVGVMASERFAAGWLVAPILCIKHAVHGYFYFLSGSIQYDKHRSRWLLLVSGTALAVNVVANLLLIPRLGMIGAAWAGLLASLTYVAVGSWLVRRTSWMRWPLLRPALTLLLGAAIVSIEYLPAVERLRATLAPIGIVGIKTAVVIVLAAAVGWPSWRTLRASRA